ncbi:hypothetical protein [Streptomyces sp. NPDC092370]|uniref:hypothetical protein n=1 Tax=Streptomyces sp. NPDC092370 TaxID=3366016 RepID=UPI0037F3389B
MDFERAGKGRYRVVVDVPGEAPKPIGYVVKWRGVWQCTDLAGNAIKTAPTGMGWPNRLSAGLELEEALKGE